jgi:peroxiredoxin
MMTSTRWIARAFTLALIAAAPTAAFAGDPHAGHAKPAAKTEAAATAATVGQKAPDFSLVDQDGKKHNLAQYKGKTVVLEWTNPGCPFVKRHYSANTMETTSKAYADKGVVWLAINSTNTNTAADSKKFIAEEKLAYPTLLDTDGTVGKLYGAKTTPHMFVIDPKGVVIYMGAFDDQPERARASTSDGRNFVDEALTSAMAGRPVGTPVTTAYGCSVQYQR